jgi:cell division protein FtsI/penicillin-binding protein 2
VEGYQIAGKTGTAQLMLKVPNGVDKNGRPRYKYIYSNSEYLASFVGFAPADNPRFLLLVSIENPRHGAHSGGGAAAPVFKKIAQRTLQHLQVPPSFPVEHKTASAKR